MQNVVSLVRKHDKDGVEKPDQGQRGEEWEETRLEEVFAGEIPNSISGDDPGREGDAKVLRGP